MIFELIIPDSSYHRISPVFPPNVPKSRTFIYTKKANFNFLSEAMIIIFSLALLCWWSSFWYTRITLPACCPGVQGQGVHQWNQHSQASSWIWPEGRKHKQNTKTMRSVYLFHWVSPWMFTSSFCCLPGKSLLLLK